MPSRWTCAQPTKCFIWTTLSFAPTTSYGERQTAADRYRNVMGIFMNQVMTGKPCTIFGDGSQTRAFTHIADVAPVIARSVQVPEAYGQVFNLGADTPYSVLRLAEAVQTALGRQTGVNVYSAPARSPACDFGSWKGSRGAGACASVDLECGLKRMADWARSVGPRESIPFGRSDFSRLAAIVAELMATSEKEKTSLCRWVFFAAGAKPTSMRKAVSMRIAESEPVVVVEQPVSALRDRRLPSFANRQQVIHGVTGSFLYRPLHLPQELPDLWRYDGTEESKTSINSNSVAYHLRWAFGSSVTTLPINFLLFVDLPKISRFIWRLMIGP